MRLLIFLLFIVSINLSFSQDNNSCEFLLQKELLDLLEKDKDKILPLQFQVTMLKMLKEVKGSNSKSIEKHLSSHTNKLKELDTKDPTILKKLENIYLKQNMENNHIFQSITALGEKSTKANYNQADKRLTNADLSSFLLADIINKKDSQYTKRDVAITWYMQKISDQVKMNEGGKSYTYSQNMMQLSNRLARYTGAIGDAETATQEEIDNEIKRSQKIIDDFTQKSLAELKQKLPYCFSTNTDLMGCEKDLKIYNQALDNLILNSEEVVAKTFDETFNATLKLAKESIPKEEPVNVDEKQVSNNRCVFSKLTTLAHKMHFKDYYTPCFKKQKALLGTYNHNLKKAIKVLQSGLEYEVFKGSDPDIIYGIESKLADLVIESAYVKNVYDQINDSLKENQCSFPIIKDNNIRETEIRESVCNALGGCDGEDDYLTTMSDRIVKKIYGSIKKNGRKWLVKEALESVEGAAFQYLAGKIRVGTVAGSLKSLGLDLFVYPLKGSTIAANTKWKDTALENPNVLLNPTWYYPMVEGSTGQNDILRSITGWRAHCAAYRDYGPDMNKLTRKLKKQPLNKTFNSLTSLIDAIQKEKKEKAKNAFDPVAEKMIPKVSTPSDTIEYYDGQNEDAITANYPLWLGRLKN